MAEIREVYLVDDLDGETREGVAPLSFGLDGKDYDIDLSPENTAKLRDALADFVAAARKAPGAPAGRRTARRATSTGGRGNVGAASENQLARTWLVENGYQVSARGRISADMLDIYRRRDTLDGGVVEESPASKPEAKELANGELATDYVANAVPVAKPFDLGDPELDDRVKAWHEAKGLKIPASGKVNSVMRKRYQKAHEAA